MRPTETLISLFLYAQGFDLCNIAVMLTCLGDSAREDLEAEILWHYSIVN